MTSEPDAAGSAQPDPPAQPASRNRPEGDPAHVPLEPVSDGEAAPATTPEAETGSQSGSQTTETTEPDLGALPPSARPRKSRSGLGAESRGTIAAKVAIALADIKIAHSVFALPFAVLAAFLAGPGLAMIAHADAIATMACISTPST